jgi:hypothetical protein
MKCIFGCDEERNGVYGHFWLPQGCFCHADQEQDLCVQHFIKCTTLDGIYWIYYWGA